MANYANLLALIAANVYENHDNKVTAEMVKSALNAIVSTLVAGGYLCEGVAHPDDPAVTPDANVFYFATEPGTYTNKGGWVVAEGEAAILKYNGSWSKESTGLATTGALANLQKELYITIDISGLTQWKRIILSDGLWQSYGSGYLSVDIPIIPGQRYFVKAGETTGIIALLKSEAYASGATPDYCVGFSGRIAISPGEGYSFIAPADAAYLYMTIQSSGVDRDTEAKSYYLGYIFSQVKETQSPVCVCRFDRGSLNPNGLYNNSYIAISRRFNPDYDSLLVFGNKDAPAVTNKFWDLFGLYVIARGDRSVAYPPDVVSFGTSIAAATTTDSILPVIVGAVNDIDGDNTSHWFTGQNHAYGNVSAGVTPTMREVSCDVSVDGAPVAIGELAVRGKVCKIEVVNMVQGFNTCKEDGTGREIIKQKISVLCTDDKCSVRVEYLALEDVVFYNIPGFGMYGAPNTGRKFRLIGSLTKPKAYDYDGTQISPAASDNKVNVLQFSRNGVAMEVRVKDVGLGNMLLNTTENNAYSTTANKVYTRLTASGTEFQLPEGGLLAFEFDIDVKDAAL